MHSPPSPQRNAAYAASSAPSVRNMNQAYELCKLCSKFVLDTLDAPLVRNWRADRMQRSQWQSFTTYDRANNENEIHTYIYTSRNTFIFTYIHTYVHAYTSTKVKPSISIVVVIHLHELHATGCKPLSNKCLLPALNQYPQDTVARRW